MNTLYVLKKMCIYIYIYIYYYYLFSQKRNVASCDIYFTQKYERRRQHIINRVVDSIGSDFIGNFKKAIEECCKYGVVFILTFFLRGCIILAALVLFVVVKSVVYKKGERRNSAGETCLSISDCTVTNKYVVVSKKGEKLRQHGREEC